MESKKVELTNMVRKIDALEFKLSAVFEPQN